MTEYGILEKDLDELWAVKLKFAYGSIKPPEDLIDVFSLAGFQTSLPGGVSVRREGPNLYTLIYRNETVSVDLNLPEGKDWFPSYTLSCGNVEEGIFR